MNLMLPGLLYPMTRNKCWDIKKIYRLLIVHSMESLVQKGTSILNGAVFSKMMFHYMDSNHKLFLLSRSNELNDNKCILNLTFSN